MPAKSFASENVSASNYKTTSFSHPSLLTVGSVHSGAESKSQRPMTTQPFGKFAYATSGH